MALNPDKNGLLWIDDLTGGLNDTDPPQDIADNQCQQAENIEWIATRFAQRRQGGTNPIGTEPWGSQANVYTLMRHTPTADEGAAELWGVSDEATPIMGRLAAGSNFAAVTVGDAWTRANVKFINGVSLNGKFFIAGDTTQDRLHVWDGSTFRRAGLATPAAPTVANTGAGAYAAITRYYKVQWVNGGQNVHGEASAAVSFTPSGAGTAARVSRPALPGESETDWNLFASPDGVNYYLIGFAAAATTFIDDSTAPANYATLFPTLVGYPISADYNTAPKSAKYLVADEDRLVLAGFWETASMASAVMWTPITGTTPAVYSFADDERVPSTNRLDLDRQEGGGITGLASLNGSLYVFKIGRIYKLVRTGNATKPYRPVDVSKSIGAVSHKSIVLGEDDTGAACLYFWSRRGPYRIASHGGLEYLGRDIEATTLTVDYGASAAPPFGVWHGEKRQVQWWVSTQNNVWADQKLVFHVRFGRADEHGNIRGGWAVHTQGAAEGFAAVMFANVMGSSMSLDLKPHLAQRWTSGLPDGPVVKYDADGTFTDRGGNATAYPCVVLTKAFSPGGRGVRGGVTTIYVIAKPFTSRVLTTTIQGDFGLSPYAASVTVPAAVGAETRQQLLVEDFAGAADMDYAQFYLADTGLGNTQWMVDAVGLRVHAEATR